MKSRECGTCTACCYGLVVEAIDKPAFQCCRHTVTDGGCGNYAKRPSACRNFRCLWLEGHLSEEDRPDRLGVIFTTTQHGQVGTHPLLVEVTAGAAAAANVRAAVRRLTEKTPVLVATAAGGTFHPRRRPTAEVQLTVNGEAA